MALAEAPLKTSRDATDSVTAGTLWADGPCVVIVLRRPGCLLCREQSVRIWNAREQYEAAGVKLVCVVHEWIDREIAAFRPEYWGGPLYYDEGKAFYKAVHGGALRKGSLLALLNPFGEAWRNGKRAQASGLVKESNLNGDGLTMGGLLVVARGGDVVYSHGEKTFGDHAPEAEVLAAARKAGGGSK